MTRFLFSLLLLGGITGCGDARRAQPCRALLAFAASHTDSLIVYASRPAANVNTMCMTWLTGTRPTPEKAPR